MQCICLNGNPLNPAITSPPDLFKTYTPLLFVPLVSRDRIKKSFWSVQGRERAKFFVTKAEAKQREKGAALPMGTLPALRLFTSRFRSRCEGVAIFGSPRLGFFFGSRRGPRDLLGERARVCSWEVRDVDTHTHRRSYNTPVFRFTLKTTDH